MIKRQLERRGLSLLKSFPAIAILGPRQVGKTTLAKLIIKEIKKDAVYLDLELPQDASKLANPEIYFELNEKKCVVIDEIQRQPELFPILRAIIDQHRTPGRFVLLGSASPDLLRKSSETLAGRIIYTELTPLNCIEIRHKIDLNTHWFRGGFPEPLLAKNLKIAAEWHRSFIKTYVERDLRNLGLNASPALLFRFISMLAHNQGGIWNASNYAKSLGISSPTVANYLDFMENAYLVRRLHSFHVNANKRIIKAPKVYVRDSGIVHNLAGINNINGLLGHPVIGSSWEGYVIEQVISVTQNSYEYYYYRTQDGTECDLILAKGSRPLACIEIKFTTSPKKTKSFTNSIVDLKTKNNFIIIPKCNESYPLDKNITVCNVEDFILDYLPKID